MSGAVVIRRGNPQAVFPAGSRAPFAIRVAVESCPVSSGGLDLTTVTSASIHARKTGSDVVRVLAAILFGPVTPTAATLLHVLATDGSDFAEPGEYTLQPHLAIGAGELICQPPIYILVPESI